MFLVFLFFIRPGESSRVVCVPTSTGKTTPHPAPSPFEAEKRMPNRSAALGQQRESAFIGRIRALPHPVAQVSKPAVSPISKSAGAATFGRVRQVEAWRGAGRPAGLETRDTADLEVCATQGQCADAPAFISGQTPWWLVLEKLGTLRSLSPCTEFHSS